MLRFAFGTFFVFTVVFFLIAHVYFCQGEVEDLSAEEVENVYDVDRVIDGNTIRLANRRKVRLLGVDAPELHHVDQLAREAARHRIEIKTVRERGERAYRFLNDSIGGGKIRLAYDWVKRDEEGSILAYVYLEDGTFVNATMLLEGYAYAYTSSDYAELDKFGNYQEEAEEMERGFWSENLCQAENDY